MYIWCFTFYISMKNLDKETKDNNILEKLSIGILIAIIFIMVFNAVQIRQLNKPAETSTTEISATETNINLDILPRGVPEVYGDELGVSFDDVSTSNQQKADYTIEKVGSLDQITLSGNDLERYISIVSKISCEYCCGAESIITPDGKAACGCSHSFAMRGLAKYLIKNHGDEYTDDEILEELGKWKTLFFPGQITEKAKILQQQGIELNYINLASNKYRGIEQGTNSGMVGGC